MSALFSPLSIGPLKLANRIVIPPMCQYSAHEGQATDWHLMHLGSLALSGAGLLIVEATAVEPAGRISAGDLGLWSDATEAALGRVLKSVRQYSAMPIAIQLGHAGRKASSQRPWEGAQLITPERGGWPTLAPSATTYSPSEPAPQALSLADMDRIHLAFVTAARRAQRLGLDAIELHAAHGYLLHEFLSPLSNERSDGYGGTLENRMRYPLEVFDGVRAAVPGMVLGVRISATDWVEGGWELEQSVLFGQALRARGCDYIHVSSGGLSPQQQIPLGPNYQVPLAERVKRDCGMLTIAVGLITEAEQAQDIIAQGQADAVALGRAMLYDPRWPWHAAAQLGAQVQAPPQYWRCQPRDLSAARQGQTKPAGALFGEVRLGMR